MYEKFVSLFLPAPAVACILTGLLRLWINSTDRKYFFKILSTQPIAIVLTIINFIGADVTVLTSTLSITGVRAFATHRFELTQLISLGNT